MTTHYGRCQARGKKRKRLGGRGGRIRCDREADTIRRIEAAPGFWVHVELCHDHQYIWDEAGKWGGAILYREDRDGFLPPSIMKQDR